ncbi:TonB-dependent receptor plug domain-containing protein [Niabella sp. W65]|nr:TonB-dependent receptor plug domain-containing protein [Niabella sp. W65]MCH7361953.1 TonB-dependent receptor plug domain-containing protein [Niabella sp. W65]ULT46318.1 TonB-dependent receptor plug domain-containing protein [Niabella sp. I65]
MIKIRGAITSFQGTTKPLILLDNVEIPSIQIVNPNDIATITILKDAAAASIYGAKASNGVVLITTKKVREVRNHRSAILIISPGKIYGKTSRWQM